MIKISEITKRDIFDIFRVDFVNYYGRLNEIEFLKRIYNLKKMPSTDSIFENAEGDIWQYTLNNDDWDEDHEKMEKGITLSKDELITLKEILDSIDIENLDM